MTSPVDIHPPREDEFDSIVALDSLAFGEEPTPEDAVAYRAAFPFERALAAYEDGKVVASSAVLSLELTVPGRVSLPMGGVTWIATLPTHRRRGLLRRLMTAQFAAMAEKGEPVAALLASEGSIYGRFGFGPATSVMSFSVERPHGAFASPVSDPGRITLLDRGEAETRLPAVYDQLRPTQVGAVSRPAGWWHAYLHDPLPERQGASGMHHAMHETADGDADGYVSYRIKAEWEASTPLSEVQVVELVAADSGVYKALWDYILCTDLCRTASCGRGRVDEPLRWLLADPRRFEVKALADDLYLRLLDVPRALAARAYGGEDELVMEVVDHFPTAATTRFLLRTGPAGTSEAECSPTTREPDLSLSIDSLGAAYLGGVSFTTLAAAGRVRASTTGASERADMLFCTATAPFCSTMF